ncbi:hypothetical protein EK21DRAFT_73552 [Setomelanomma holmii]|uniref:J domain-containing protein n=1 Tax=Setomelanomma holmii TaxID=210430 RepID=A0A9P4H339_9PLEO|nr:hypothetical protein EK21DRAFT_73552 [Setomelanomma holmii]
MERDYYNDLGIEAFTSSAEVKSAFHAAAKKHHPDKSGDTDSTAFRHAREAYVKLSNSTYRADYDRRYRASMAEEGSYGTPATTFEAEDAQSKASSPPPYKPVRKTNESSTAYYLGRAYLAWQKRQAAYEVRHPELYDDDQPHDSDSMAHGLRVNKKDHPSEGKRCTLKTEELLSQSGTNDCVFCLRRVTGCSKCSGCEAMACGSCLTEIIGKERDRAYVSHGSRTGYATAGS